jgi:hypothetical protein
MFFIYLFVAIAIAITVYQFWEYNIPHTHYENVHLLSCDAKIVDIKHEKESWGRSKYIRTIVFFSDGFQYHTHKCRAVPGLGYQTLYVNSDVLEIIIKRAIRAHDRLIAKR